MIKMKITTGPHAGKVRDVTYQDPEALIGFCFLQGWGWEIDYNWATVGERFEWGRQDMILRIVRAIQESRPIKFMDRVYLAETPEEKIEVAQQVEDAVANSGRMVTIVHDNARELLIGVREIVQ